MKIYTVYTFPHSKHEGRNCNLKNWGAEERVNLFLLDLDGGLPIS